MNKRVKTLILVVCALVLVVSGVFATLAYLNDTTDEVVNAISVGDVEISMDEYRVSYNEYYEETVHINEDRVKLNNYNLIPGVTYTKDPTIHVDKTSEPAYVFVKLYNGIERAETAVEGKGTIAQQMAALGWVELKTTNFAEGVLTQDYAGVFVYNGAKCDGSNKYIVNAKKTGADVDLVVFEKFAIDSSLDYGSGNPDLKDFQGETIKLKAFAIQALGGVTLDTAAAQANAALVFEADQD